jgi:hypothetical protein
LHTEYSRKKRHFSADIIAIAPPHKAQADLERSLEKEQKKQAKERKAMAATEEQLAVKLAQAADRLMSLESGSVKSCLVLPTGEHFPFSSNCAIAPFCYLPSQTR